MALVLFDEAHGELLSSQADREKDREMDTRTRQEKELQALRMDLTSHTETLGGGVIRAGVCLLLTSGETQTVGKSIQRFPHHRYRTRIGHPINESGGHLGNE